jgi:hypothetical protein
MDLSARRVLHPLGYGDGREDVTFPHRNTASLNSPECIAGGRCMRAERGCVEEVEARNVARAPRQLLQRLTEAPRAVPAVA